MEGGVFGAITSWSAEEMSSDDLLAVLESSRASIAEHREAFSAVVGGLLPRQVERCRELIDYAFSLLDLLDWELAEAVEALAASDRGRLFRAGDQMSRARFQLNQTFVELNHQALLALGPTKVPNLNHLLALRADALGDPERRSGELRQAVDEELTIISRSLADLEREAELSEVVTTRNALTDQLAALTGLGQALLQAPIEQALDQRVFDSLEKRYLEIAHLLPVVQMKLRSQGQTRLPDLNLVLNLLDDIEQGRLGDMPVAEALEALEASFAATESKCEMAAKAERSVLIAQEIRATLETFALFHDALDAVYRFLEERELAWLERGRSQLLEFGSRFLAHEQRLGQLHEQQDKILCPFCSHFNDLGSARCGRCSKPLPLNLGLPDVDCTFEVLDHRPAEAARELLITTNLAPVYQAVREIEEGGMDEATFLAVLDKFEATIESGIDRVPAEPAGGGSSADLLTLYDLLDEGVAEIGGGLGLLRGYPKAREQTLLLAGVAKIDGGAKKVADAGARARRWKP